MLRYGYSLNTIQVTRNTGRGTHATLRYSSYDQNDVVSGRYSVQYSSPRFLCLLLAVNDADGYGKRKATIIL